MNETPIATLKDVAELAKVSLPTASLVLNGHGTKSRIAQTTTERVHAAAKKLGYRANPFATSLRHRRSRTLGVLWVFAGPHGSNQLVRSFTERARESGYSVLVHDTIADISLIQKQLQELARLRTDGVVVQLMGQEKDIPQLLPLLQRHPQVVMVVDYPVDLPYPQIIHSRKRALADALHYLYASGKRRVGLLRAPNTNMAKIRVIEEVLQEAGDNFMEWVELPGIENCVPDPSSEAIHKLLFDSGIPPLDAILTATDETAAAAISVLQKAGKRVPEDVAVIGFNNSTFTSFITPPLASVRRYDEQVASCALKRLITNIEQNAAPQIQAEIIEMEFVWRESAGTLPPTLA